MAVSLGLAWNTVHLLGVSTPSHKQETYRGQTPGQLVDFSSVRYFASRD